MGINLGGAQAEINNTTNTTNTDNSTTINGLTGAEAARMLAAQGASLNDLASTNARAAATADEEETARNLATLATFGTALADQTAAGVATTKALTNTMNVAAQANRDTAIAQANANAAILMNKDNKEAALGLAQISKDVSLAQLQTDKDIKVAAINSDQQLQLAKMGTQERAAALNVYSGDTKYLAALAMQGAMTGQENVAALATQSNMQVTDLAKYSLQAMSQVNQINAVQREANAEAAADNAIKATGVALGPNGIQGILGTQGNLMNDQTQQFLRFMYESEKLKVSVAARDEEKARPASADEFENTASRLRLDALNKQISEAQATAAGLAKIALAQQKDPSLINKPASEIIAAVTAEVASKTIQNCRGGTNQSGSFVVSGSNQQISNITLNQNLKFNASCMQEVSRVVKLQSDIATSLSQIMSINRKLDTVSLGMDSEQMDQKIRQDVTNKFSAETIQDIANNANQSMDFKFSGDRNVVNNVTINQTAEYLSQAVQHEVMNLDIMNGVKQALDSKVDSNKQNTDTSQNAGAGSGAGSGDGSGSNMTMIIGVVVAIILLLLVVGVVLSKKKSGADEGLPQDSTEHISTGGCYHCNKNKSAFTKFGAALSNVLFGSPQSFPQNAYLGFN